MPHLAPLSTDPVLPIVRADAESFAKGSLKTGCDKPLVTVAMFPQAAESRWSSAFGGEGSALDGSANQ